LGFGAQVLQALLERLTAKLIEQRFGQFSERDARSAHIGVVARQFAEQRQVIPHRLQMLQCTAVFFRRSDVRDHALEVAIKINAFEFDGHGPRGELNAKTKLILSVNLIAASY